MYDQIVNTLGAFLVASDSGPSDGFKIAIVSALGVVVAASVPALLSTREREPHSVADVRKQRDKLQRKLDWRDKYIENLEALLWQHEIDPRTVKPENEP